MIEDQLRRHAAVMTAAYWAGVEDERERILLELQRSSVLVDENSYHYLLSVVNPDADPSVAV